MTDTAEQHTMTPAQQLQNTMTTEIEQRANDLLAITSRQRESGLDSAAYLYADLQAAKRRIAALEAQVAKLNEDLAAARNSPVPVPAVKRKPVA